MYIQHIHREKLSQLQLRFNVANKLNTLKHDDDYVVHILHLILLPFRMMFVFFDIAFWDINDTIIWIDSVRSLCNFRQTQIMMELYKFMNDMDDVITCLENIQLQDTKLGSIFLRYVHAIRDISREKSISQVVVELQGELNILR